MNYYRLVSKIYEKAAKKMCWKCQPFIEKGSKILDLGCGSGIVGKTFSTFFQAEVLGVDIKDSRIVNLPFQIIDGRSLPFSENFFDVILINYVLHHTQNPAEILKEAKRVGEKIIIFEDLPEGFLSKLICKFHGISYNKLFRNPNPIFFKSEKDWEKIFDEIGLKIIFKKRIHNFPVKKDLFVLAT